VPLFFRRRAHRAIHSWGVLEAASTLDSVVQHSKQSQRWVSPRFCGMLQIWGTHRISRQSHPALRRMMHDQRLATASHSMLSSCLRPGRTPSVRRRRETAVPTATVLQRIGLD